MNDDFKAYIERYCKKHKCTVEEALQHEIVKEVGKQYQEKIDQKEGNI